MINTNRNDRSLCILRHFFLSSVALFGIFVSSTFLSVGVFGYAFAQSMIADDGMLCCVSIRSLLRIGALTLRTNQLTGHVKQVVRNFRASS